MAIPVKLRRSGTTTATPSSLEYGEIAINYADGVVFYRDTSDVIQSFTLQAYALSSHTHAASDITSGTLDAARLPLATTGAVGGVIVGTGLGVSSGTVSVTYGTTSGTACQGNDSRLSDARTPTAHKTSHATGGSDALTPSDIGAAPLASPTFTGTVTVPGLTATAAILADDLSSANSVVYSFDGDPNTGVGRGGADILTLVTNGSERVRVDASGNVGIGTGSGRAVAGYTFVSINGSSGAYTDYYSNGTRVGEIGAEPASFNVAAAGASRPLNLVTNSATRVTVASDGAVTMPDVYSDTVGATHRDLYIDDTGKLGYESSIRHSKTDIVTLDDVSWLSALSPVSYRYRKQDSEGNYTAEADGVTDYGLIAEDVEAVKPELCFYDQVDGEPQLRGVTYSKLITPMLRYIQQLEQRIAALEEKINA